MLSKSLSFSVFFLWHPHTHLFLQSWPGVSRVCSKLSAQDYWRKSGRPSNMSKCFQHDANKTVSLPLYKHVNVLEHLRRNPFADTQWAGTMRLMADHISELNGYSWLRAPGWYLCVCACHMFVWPTVRLEDSCDDGPNQSQRPLERRVQELFWQWAPLGACQGKETELE